MSVYSNCQFIMKLVEIMEQFPKLVQWSLTGKQVVFVDLFMIQEQILPKYFRHKNLASFTRQLNMYGFGKKQITTFGTQFSHQIFLKGNQNNFHKIQRKQKKKNKKCRYLKFQQKNAQIMDQIKLIYNIPQNTQNLLFQMLQQKDSHWQCMKKLKSGLQSLFEELKDLRSQRLKKIYAQIEQQFYPALQQCLNTGSQINQFLKNTIMRQNDAQISQIASGIDDDNYCNFGNDDNEQCSMQNYLQDVPINSYMPMQQQQEQSNENMIFLKQCLLN